MSNKTKDIIVTILFASCIITIFMLNVIAKDKDISFAERRKLSRFPEITIKKLTNGEVTKNLEKYSTDQFVGREFFRQIKAFVNTKIYKQKDNNKVFEKDKGIYSMDYPLKEANIQKSAEKILNVYEKHLKGMDVYYAIIPDKNYYLEGDEYLKIDYTKLKNIMQKSLQELQYIDIWNDLKTEDYYKTDLHWKQENLQGVVKKIQEKMKLEKTNFKYDVINKGDFYGAYYGQIASKIKPDAINILTNETIEKCVTYNVETSKIGKIYEEPKTTDKYDIYLSGATPIITIENPNSKTDKELLLFRDSFGSSIAPLLVENYKKITLIDLRYISSNLLENYIEFKNQDVLFLYSTLILNQNVLK